MQTLLLDVNKWDLAADASGNIAVASDPYSQAQDAASYIKVISGEMYFDTTRGIPYFSQILGYAPPISLIKAYYNDAALSVPGVVTSQCFITTWVDRVLTGQIQITNSNSQTSAAGF